MLEWCLNDAGQIPMNTITHFHTVWNDAMNDARTMLEQCLFIYHYKKTTLQSPEYHYILLSKHPLLFEQYIPFVKEQTYVNYSKLSIWTVAYCQRMSQI